MLEHSFQGTHHMESTNFKQCTADPCIFVSSEGTDLTIIAVYVDDLIIIIKTPEKMRWIKNNLATRFKMKDLGKLHYCLGITMTKRESVCGCTKGSIFTHCWKDMDYLKQNHPILQPTPRSSYLRTMELVG